MRSLETQPETRGRGLGVEVERGLNSAGRSVGGGHSGGTAGSSDSGRDRRRGWPAEQRPASAAEDPRTALAPIDVSSSGSTVTLIGQVVSGEVREAAEQIARSVPGVAVVINALEVRPHDLEGAPMVPAWVNGGMRGTGAMTPQTTPMRA